MPERTEAITDTVRLDEKGSDEFAEVVSSLLKAGELLAALQRGPRYKRELADALGVSKSTIYNWTSELETYNLLERTSDGYRLTYVGQRMAEQFFDWRTRAQRLFQLAPFADALPSKFGLPPDALESATVVVTREDPDAPANAFFARLRDAERVSMVLPVASSRCLDAINSCRASDDGRLELVVSTGTHDRLGSAFADSYRRLRTASGCTVLVVDQQPSFGLARFEGEDVGLTIYSSQGHFVGFVHMSSAESLEWASDVYESYRQGARPVGSGEQADLQRRGEPTDVARNS